MAFIAADSYHSTIATIAGGTGITSFTVTSASGFPTLATGDFTVMRLDDTGTAEDVTVTDISGTTVTCLATTSAHANGNSIDGAILTTSALAQIKDDAQSGFPVNALSGAGALVKGTGVRNHVTISSAATLTLANGTYKGECCRISIDRTSTAQATVDPAGGTLWDGVTTIALFAGDVIIGAWDGTGWITLDKYSSFATPIQVFIAGNWYGAQNLNYANGIALATGTMRFIPFYVPYTITISDVGTRITTLSGGGNFNIGVWANGTSNQPTGAVLANTGNMSTAATGVITGALGANLQLKPGIYWFGFQFDNGTAIANAIGANNCNLLWQVGVASAANSIAAGAACGIGWTATVTYGTFPTNPTITEVSANNASNPGIIYKVASVP